MYIHTKVETPFFIHVYPFLSLCGFTFGINKDLPLSHTLKSTKGKYRDLKDFTGKCKCNFIYETLTFLILYFSD